MLKDPEILIIGGGNAGLCSALAARETTSRRIVVVEVAPKTLRGGNSRHTRNFRCMHSKPLGHLSEAYDENEFLEDLLKVTNGKTDLELAKMTIRLSEDCYKWKLSNGVHFQPSLQGTLSLGRTNAFFLGGGKALLNAYYNRAQSRGIEILYNTKAIHLKLSKNKIVQVDLQNEEGIYTIHPKAIIVASGGFEANLEWLVKAWGPQARNFLVRGTPYNRGEVLRDLLQQGLPSVGDPTQCHAVAIDGNAPKFDGGIVTRIDCVPFSIVVNKEGKRFYDEGEDLWPKRYAIWGRLVANQPDQVGYAIIDSRSKGLFMPTVSPPFEADNIEEIASNFNLPKEELVRTVETFNKSCRPGDFKPNELDHLSTKGLVPKKSNWARPIVKPPFYGYVLRPGVTFTYLGLKINQNGQVLGKERPVTNLWAAGEIMAGSILGQGYLAGFGMTIGTVFGRIAGREAANYVQ